VKIASLTPVVLVAVLAAAVVSAPVLAAAGGVGSGPPSTTWDPAWSPDGSRIAFGSIGGRIESVNPAGTELHVLTQTPAGSPPDSSFSHDFQPVWAPDGRQLAFGRDWRYYNSGRTWDQYSLSLLDTGTGLVTALGEGADPTWSRTGVLAYDIFDGPYLDSAGFVAGSRTIRGDLAGPSWSPDGRRLAYTGDDVFVMNRDGTHRRRLAHGSDPHWSPDGRWIAYRTSNETHIDLVSPDGKQHRRLATVEPSDASIVWSPGGARLAVGTTIVTFATGKARHLGLSLGDYPGPSWSPDGRWLVYASDLLEIVHPDGSRYHTINPCTLTPSAP
jgi:Tol biopolymer transport system component